MWLKRCQRAGDKAGLEWSKEVRGEPPPQPSAQFEPPSCLAWTIVDSLLTGCLPSAPLALHSTHRSQAEFFKHNSHFFPAQSPVILHLDAAANTICMSFLELSQCSRLGGSILCGWSALPWSPRGHPLLVFPVTHRYHLRGPQFCFPQDVGMPSWSRLSQEN